MVQKQIFNILHVLLLVSYKGVTMPLFELTPNSTHETKNVKSSYIVIIKIIYNEPLYFSI